MGGPAEEVAQRIQRAGGLAAGGVAAKRVCGSMKVNRLLGTPELAQCKQRYNKNQMSCYSYPIADDRVTIIKKGEMDIMWSNSHDALPVMSWVRYTLPPKPRAPHL